MIYLSMFMYYVFFASAVLIYGVGLNKTTELTGFFSNRIIFLGKVVFSIFISSVLSWIFVATILTPLRLVELYPLVCLLIFISISIFIEALVRLTSGHSTVEFVFSYLVVLLSVAESTSIIDTMVISGSCLVAYVILVPFLLSFKNRISQNGDTGEMYYCKLLLFMAILVILIKAWDISWINLEVLK